MPSRRDEDETELDGGLYDHYTNKIGSDEERRKAELKRDFSEYIARSDADFKRLFKEAFKEWLSEQVHEWRALLGTGVLRVLLGLLKMLLIAAIGSALVYAVKHGAIPAIELVPPGTPISPILPTH